MDAGCAPVARRVPASFRYRTAAVAGGTVTVTFTLWLATGIGGPKTLEVVSDYGLVAAALTAAVSCGARARRESGRIRYSWALVALGTLSWGLGQAMWTWYECVLGRQVPFPSLADVGYLGMPVLTAAGLLTVPLAAQSAANRARSLLDGTLVSIGLLLISYLLLLKELIAAGADSAISLIISLAYPVSDVVIVTVVVFIFARDRHRHSARMPLLLVGAGLVTFAFSDSGFAYLTMIGAYSSGSVIDAGWFAGFLLLAVAGRAPVREAASEQDDSSAVGVLGVMLPYLTVVVAVVISGIDTLHGEHGTSVVYWGRSLLILLIVCRQALTMMENRGLTKNLEARVRTRTAELWASEQRFRALVQHSSDVVTVIDLDTVVTYQSESITQIFGYDATEVTGQPLGHLLHPADLARVREAVNTVASRPYRSTNLELAVIHADGYDCRAEMTITNLLEDVNVAGLVLNTRDITEQKRLEGQLVHEAFHDSLTGLANRALFADRVDHELRRRDTIDASVAVLFLDLDGFKEINDSRGHAVGDQILVEVGRRLLACTRAEDTVARFGGDEFAILASTSTLDESVEDLARRVIEAIEAPFTMQDTELHVTVSVGIAYAGPDALDAGGLLRNADLAMYRTKANGARGYTLYHPDMHTELIGRLELAAEMRRGLAADEFSVHFQPNIDLSDGRILGFEALARWQHPTRGFVPPLEFIPLAETTGLICQLGTWVLEEACKQAAEWTAHENRPIAISVNVSARQLDQSDFVDIVREALAKSGLAPEQLCLEITESMLVDDSDAVLEIMNTLKQVGVRLAIDDFGTGYSSLSYLNRLPFDVLKIDKSFIDRLNSAGGQTTLARTIVQLGQGLGVRTVAEGLEHFDQFMALRRMGCDVGQGYYFSKPVPAEEAAELLVADASTSWPGDVPVPTEGEELTA
jgi:diguanylate cyclase (GGDEF)-like protein/PAS domain S-box-containing protein